jgi:hypothetical protein
LESNEEAVTSLKAYRVEFIEPLTEYPGTKNGRREHQNTVVGGSLSALELVVSLRHWNGQVDAKKLAQLGEPFL